MIQEIVKLIPRLDRAALASMEFLLSKRFQSVAKKFGKGLEAIMKGNLLFLSLGFITQLLNPLEKVHDKIKELLGEGFDLGELSARFNTTPGTIRQMMAVGKALGVEPQRLSEMMTKYAETIEAAREELKDKTKIPSEATEAVRQFVDEKDLARSFEAFIRSLSAFGNRADKIEMDMSTGRQVLPQDRDRRRREGLIRDIDGAELRREIEKVVFAGVQTGSSARLIDADFPKILEKLGFAQPTAGTPAKSNQLESVLQNLIDRAGQQRFLEARNELTDLMKSGNLVTEPVVSGMEAADERERAVLRRQLAQAEQLQEAQKNIDEIKRLLMGLSESALKVLSYLGTFIPQIEIMFQETLSWAERTLNDISMLLGDVKKIGLDILNSRVFRLFKGGGL